MYPNLAEDLSRKDESLDDRLKQVFVTRTDIQPPQIETTDKSLPLDRHTEDFEFGFKEPERVTIGRCTLRQTLQFLTDHQINPDLWNASKIAEEYKLKEAVVVDILTHFRSFQLHIPTKGSEDKQKILISPSFEKTLLNSGGPIKDDQK